MKTIFSLLFLMTSIAFASNQAQVRDGLCNQVTVNGYFRAWYANRYSLEKGSESESLGSLESLETLEALEAYLWSATEECSEIADEYGRVLGESLRSNSSFFKYNQIVLSYIVNRLSTLPKLFLETFYEELLLKFHGINLSYQTEILNIYLNTVIEISKKYPEFASSGMEEINYSMTRLNSYHSEARTAFLNAKRQLHSLNEQAPVRSAELTTSLASFNSSQPTSRSVDQSTNQSRRNSGPHWSFFPDISNRVAERCRDINLETNYSMNTCFRERGEIAQNGVKLIVGCLKNQRDLVMAIEIPTSLYRNYRESQNTPWVIAIEIDGEYRDFADPVVAEIKNDVNYVLLKNTLSNGMRYDLEDGNQVKIKLDANYSHGDAEYTFSLRGSKNVLQRVYLECKGISQRRGGSLWDGILGE